MKHIGDKLLLAIMAAMTVATISCNTDMYDEETYKKIIKYNSPVDSVDQRHEWRLYRYLYYRFQTGSLSDAQQIRIYNDNPFSSSNAKLMATGYISKGSSETQVSVSVPYYYAENWNTPAKVSTLYAAVIMGDGTCQVSSFPIEKVSIDLSTPIATGTLATAEPPLQTFTYLYEQDQPQPGDYDYNDLVMRVGHQRTGEREMTISVTLAAVGADAMLAGALRLVGYNYEDIDSVVTTDGKSFNDGVPSQSLYIFENTDLLMKGRNNEAVLNLFADAHWAIDGTQSTDYGFFTRYKYNVSSGSSSDFMIVPTRTIKYKVYFKNGNKLNDFTFDALDPFIVKDYNSSCWETHIYGYHLAQTLKQYTYDTSFKDLPWAICVPTDNFMHTLEGCNIGFKKSGAMFGAYMVQGHSFGEWAENFTSCLDWYFPAYATRNQIY